MGLPQEEIQPEASFVKDFDFEEFQFTCLVFYIGAYFKINIRECDYSELSTIGSTIDFVEKKVRKRGSLKISRRKIRLVETLKSIPMIVRLSSNKNLTYLHLSYLPLNLT
jgi:acyl carrier protein